MYEKIDERKMKLYWFNIRKERYIIIDYNVNIDDCVTEFNIRDK